MARNKTEQNELLLERFIAWHGRYSGGIATYPDPPDAMLSIGGKNYSIELTEFRDRQKARHEGERQAVVTQAQRLYESSGGGPIDVQVLWGASGDNLRSKERDKNAEALIQLINANLPVEQESWEVEIGPEDLWSTRSAFIRDHFHLIRMHRYPGQARGHWSCPEAGFVPYVHSHEIQSIIDKKALKIDDYRNGVDEAWLIVHIGTAGPSSFGEIQPETLTHTYSAPFDRVFLMPWGSVHCLHIDQRGSTTP